MIDTSTKKEQTQGFQQRLDLRNEIFRKLFHLCGFILPLGYVYFGHTTAIRLMLVGIVIVLALDLIRLYWPPARRIYRRFFAPMSRASEEHRLTGASVFIFAQTLVALIFPSEIVPVAMTFGIVGDTAAAVIGKSVGGPQWQPNKTISGTLGSVIVSFVGGIAWMTLPWYTVLIGAAGAAIAEGLVRRLNENLVMPLVGGIVMFLVTLL